MAKPLVTVFMPVYNSARYLRAAIDSVLRQTFSNFEFLIIDDGSTDESLAIIQSYTDPRIRVLKNSHNFKLPATRNKGLKYARGEYIAFVDSDDICRLDRLAKQVQFLQNNPDVGACGSWFMVFGAKRPRLFKVPCSFDDVACALMFEPVIPNPTAMIKRRMFLKHKLFYEKRYTLYAEDFNLWQRASRRFALANLPIPLVNMRLHLSSTRQRNLAVRKKLLPGLFSSYFRSIGFKISDSEIKTHIQIFLLEFPVGDAFLQRAEKWLLKIRQLNLQNNIFNVRSLNEVLVNHWYGVCSASAKLGLSVWLRYTRSALFKYGGVRGFWALKLFIKSLSGVFCS